jgi:ATP-dependent RNA helicase RhlE
MSEAQKQFADLNLSKPLVRALDDLGFKYPTPIQEKALPVVMSGKDAIGIAQTGTGKTFAYLLPILRQLTFSEQRHPRALIVVPTRELVVQVVDEIKKLAKYMSVRVVGVYGGANINTQKTALFAGCDIVVATPGRVIDLSTVRSLNLSSLQKFVIDEVDEMLNLGFRAQLLQMMDMLPQRRQNLMFSATLTEDVEMMIEKYFYKPEYVELVSRGTPLQKIIQRSYNVLNFYTRVNLLKHLLNTDEEMTKVLLFVKNKKIADELYEEMKAEFGGYIGVIHSNKTQPQRFKAVDNFEDGIYRVLISTDVMARGLDIKDITHVINFDMPKDPSIYIHRIGRTGRADNAGIAISFVVESEQVLKRAAEALMKKKIEVLPFPEEVEINEDITQDEKPVKRDKNLAKLKKSYDVTGGGAFHEKKEKNKKETQMGARSKEGLRRLKLRRKQARSKKGR